MINKLSQVLERRGPRFVNTLLNEEVVITEKLDTFRLIFTKKDGEIKFFKKDNTPISLTERVLSDIYEEARLEIPIITHDVELPEGYYFGLYYTPAERPLRIPYSRIPRYILTDVTKRDEHNKVTEACDYSSVKEWAAVLCMGRPPVIFEGKLTEEQKNLLIAYDTKEYKGEHMSFTEMIENIFGNTYSKEEIIEGIVIKSGDKIAQIVSYEFELLNEAYEKTNESRDFYDIIISSVNEFLDSYNIPILEAEGKDEMYLKIICDIFNNYCLQEKVNEDMEAKYLMPPQFGYYGKLNKKLITDETTLKWVGTAPIYEALFKVFLSSFRKTKKPYGLLTESIVNKFNSYVLLINKYVNNFNDTEIEEEKHLNESRSENIVVNAFKKRNPTDVDNMRVIASIQKAFEPKQSDIEHGKTPCAVYLTTFEPFTNAQMNNLIRIHDMWNCPVIVCGISNKFKVEGNEFHASDEVVTAQMTALFNSDPKLIPGFALLSSWSLIEVFEYCRPQFEPIVVITDKGKKSEMTLQLFLEEEIMGGRINVDEKFNIGELDNEDKLQSFRAIEDNNYSLFLELTPECIHSVYNNIFSEYRLWSGQILKPMFND